MGMNVSTILATYGGMGRHIIFARNPALFAKVALSIILSEASTDTGLSGIYRCRSLLCNHHHTDEALCALPISPLIPIETSQPPLNSDSHTCIGLLSCIGTCSLRTMCSFVESLE